MVYRTSSREGPILQGEIISDISIFVAAPGYHLPQWSGAGSVIRSPWAVVLSQDCDLEQDYRNRYGAEGRSEMRILENILLCPARTAAEVFIKIKGQGTTVREYVEHNKNERYQYLSRVPTEQDAAGKGIDPLILDFKRYFTVSTGDLYEQVQTTAIRRCVLLPSYLEHLTTRFCYFQYRVALPDDHHRVDRKTSGTT